MQWLKEKKTKTNNDPQHTMQKTKELATRTTLNTGDEHMCSEQVVC